MLLTSASGTSRRGKDGSPGGGSSPPSVLRAFFTAISSFLTTSSSSASSASLSSFSFAYDRMRRVSSQTAIEHAPAIHACPWYRDFLATLEDKPDQLRSVQSALELGIRSELHYMYIPTLSDRTRAAISWSFFPCSLRRSASRAMSSSVFSTSILLLVSQFICL
jgi:hypothetical protein